MTRFSVTWEGICRQDNLSPTQIVDLLEAQTAELPSFELNSIHSLAIMCDEPDALKTPTSVETVNTVKFQIK